jgi:hypothetical protein
MAGSRAYLGGLTNVGSAGRYWSSSVIGIGSRGLFFSNFSSGSAGMGDEYRVAGGAVRCIKD